ncbi:MAG: cytochrome c biogenesis protein ResB [Planctomycetaceae bacterium]
MRFFASLQLAVILLVLLAGVLAAATIVETYLGPDAARWYVYESTWFTGLLALLAINVVGAAVVRFPWRRQQTGFVVTHAGLLCLLAGAAVSACGSRDGEIKLSEGESTTDMVLKRRNRFTVFHVGKQHERPFEFLFTPPPSDWNATSPLALGDVDGVRVRILELIRNPRIKQDWVADEAQVGGPAVRFRLSNSTGHADIEAWLVDQQFGEPGDVGPLRMHLERAVNDAMQRDFEHPPTENLGGQGMLLAYFGDDVLHVPVESAVGRRLPIGDSQAEVEIVACLPNARPDRLGEFTSVDDQPRNPMLELRIYPPGESMPIRQIAFARDPLLNLDGVNGRICPVTLRYLHPAVPASAVVSLLQTRDDKLYARTSDGDGSSFVGEVLVGSRFHVRGGFTLELADYFPHARRQIAFVPVRHSMGQSGQKAVEPAALVELTVDGHAQQVWMRRNDPVYGQRILQSSAGAIAAQYDLAREPLGFTLELLDFVRDTNPGNVGNAAFSSRVRLVDEQRGIDREQVISMNQPLTYAGHTFYQANFDDTGHGRASSTLSVAADPGRPFKYFGSLLVACGIFLMFYMRAYFFGDATQKPSRTEPTTPVAVDRLETVA